jgi:exopolysaccharide biosynthesis polyprenyl glycosylphosphotransferase
VGTLDNVLEIINDCQIDQVVITPPAPASLEGLIMTLQMLPIDVKVVPGILELSLSFPKLEFLEDVPIISLREPALSASSRLMKRVFDLALAVLAFILLSPVMLVLSGLLYLTSGCPIIFKQTRVGENGRLFTMYKFRTMLVGAEEDFPAILRMSEIENYVYKRPADPRITRFGRFLRRYSLDELPQFINVIKGEMSLVGPRPELPELVDKYDLWKRRRFSVPPGMTGWWQVSGRSELPLYQAVEYDLYYINNYSIFMDIKIILMTGKAVLTARGAY